MKYPDWLGSVYHAGTSDFLSNPCPTLGEQIEIRMVTPLSTTISQVVLRTCPNGEQQFSPLLKAEIKNGLQVWKGELKVNERLTPYRFGIQADDAVYWLNAAGVTMQEPFMLFDFKILADFHVIPWLRDAVFYQIFPDRFANGDPSNDPIMENIGYANFMRTTYNWGQAAPEGENNMLAFYGGDLQGISQKLDYLQNLGVNAIYLNPIFTAFSNHRYDVTDYHKVDPVLGGDDALINLRIHLNRLQMHMILDIVPNHCGYGHSWFQKALQEVNSIEAGFFYFDNYPQLYESWMGHYLLPKLNYSSHELRSRMYLGENSVFKRWLKPPFNTDGWRVDVANMLGRRDADQLDREVIPAIRLAVKDTNEDAYLIGENFYEAASQLQGDGWDGVMNYSGFTNPLMNWLIGYTTGAMGWEGELGNDALWPTEILIKSWQDYLAAIPWQISLQQFNLLDSHDTERVKTMLKGSKSLHKLAAILQFTFPGIPCVYYGDEIGLMDETGFGSRNCMPWDENQWDCELFDFYKALINFRKHSRCIKEGYFQVVYQDEDFFIYQRSLNRDCILVTANRSPQTRPAQVLKLLDGGFKEKAHFVSLIGRGDASLEDGLLSLPELPQGGVIWVPGGLS